MNPIMHYSKATYQSWRKPELVDYVLSLMDALDKAQLELARAKKVLKENERKWISCKDRLPSRGGVYTISYVTYQMRGEVIRQTADVCFSNGKWNFNTNGKYYIEAWHEKEEPYKPKIGRHNKKGSEGK